MRNSRLLTLTGPGGVGKTKLALHVSRDLSRLYPHGTWFIELAAVQDDGLVTQAVFAALGLQDRAARQSLLGSASTWRGRRRLLVLDNCEHVVASAAQFASDILRARPACSHPRYEPPALGVTGEVVVAVPTLSLPSADRPALSDALLSDAVALFVERAQASTREFPHLNEANAAAVASVCGKLDGMASGSSRGGSPPRPRTRGSRRGFDRAPRRAWHRRPSRPHRQQTLEGTIDWSYRLLDESERLLWRRLAVFAGGFEPGAVGQVCADERLPVDAIRDLVGRLVERSILKRVDGHRGGRYRILEPLRQFARQRLEESGELETFLGRHRDWVATLAAVAGAGDTRQLDAIDRSPSGAARMSGAALEFCRTRASEAEPGAEIACDLWIYWLSQGPATDVERLIDDLLALVPVTSRARGRLLSFGGLLRCTFGDKDAARWMGTEGVALGRAIRDAAIVFWSMQTVAVAAYLEGNSEEGSAIGAELTGHRRRDGLAAREIVGTRSAPRWDATAEGGARLVAAAGEGIALSTELGETWQRGQLFQFLADGLVREGELPEALIRTRGARSVAAGARRSGWHGPAPSRRSD